MTRARMLVVLLAMVGLVPAAWAYVNGGDFHSTLHDYESTLRWRGWKVCVGEKLPGDYRHVAKDIVVDPDDNADFQRYCNNLVGRALRGLPEEKVDKISLEDKRAVARITRETLRDVVGGGSQKRKEGQIGSLKYQVGVYSYETWWQTSYKEAGRHIHERRTHWVAFVAVKIAAE